jgi:hypothetical protein
VIDEERRHRLREVVRAALADRPAVRLHRAGDHHRIVRAETEDVAGAGKLRNPETDPRLDLRRLEQVARDVVRRGEELPDQAEAVGGVLERREVGRGWPGRREHRGDEPVPEHLEVDLRDLPERVGITLGEPRDALDRRVELA